MPPRLVSPRPTTDAHLKRTYLHGRLQSAARSCTGHDTPRALAPKALSNNVAPTYLACPSNRVNTTVVNEICFYVSRNTCAEIGRPSTRRVGPCPCPRRNAQAVPYLPSIPCPNCSKLQKRRLDSNLLHLPLLCILGYLHCTTLHNIHPPRLLRLQMRHQQEGAVVSPIAFPPPSFVRTQRPFRRIFLT